MFAKVSVNVLSTALLPPMSCLQQCLYRADDATPFHAAEYHHAILTLSGHACFQEYGGEEFSCRAGTFFVIPPRVPYRWRILADTLLLQCMHEPFSFLTSRGLAKLYGAAQRHIVWFDLDPAEFAVWRDRFAQDRGTPADVRGVMLSADMLRVMASALAMYKAGDSSQHPALIRAIGYLEANLHRDVSLAELARHAGMGSSRLSQLFRERVGKAPKQYLAMLKAERATTLLAVEGLRAREVADRLGFSSESYFRRFYKQQTGVAPGQLAKSPAGGGHAV